MAMVMYNHLLWRSIVRCKWRCCLMQMKASFLGMNSKAWMFLRLMLLSYYATNGERIILWSNCFVEKWKDFFLLFSNVTILSEFKAKHCLTTQQHYRSYGTSHGSNVSIFTSLRDSYKLYYVYWFYLAYPKPMYLIAEIPIINVK